MILGGALEAHKSLAHRTYLDLHRSVPRLLITMFARFIAISALLLQIVAVLGEPVPFPAPTAAPEVANVRRDFFDDIISDAHDAFSSFTDDAAERVHSFVTR